MIHASYVKKKQLIKLEWIKNTQKKLIKSQMDLTLSNKLT